MDFYFVYGFNLFILSLLKIIEISSTDETVFHQIALVILVLPLMDLKANITQMLSKIDHLRFVIRFLLVIFIMILVHVWFNII